MRKAYGIKDLLGIRVIVSANVINPVILVSIWTIKIVSAKKMLADKLAEECTENIEETRLVEIISAKNENRQNAVLARCTLFCFQCFLQLTLELVAIFIGT